MQDAREDDEYDAIIIGSGASGATVARELARHRKKVLILERGGDVLLTESGITIASIADQVKLGDGGIAAARAITVGGSTSLYFGVVGYPNLETFRTLGIDLAGDLDAVRKELPITSLPDATLGEKSRRLRDAATSMGHAWRKNDMLVDLAKCAGGYSYESKWKAKDYVDEAVKHGATLVSRATADRVLVDNGRAIGVSYAVKKRFARPRARRAYAAKIVLAAGGLASPKILRDSGLAGIGDRGFFCSPGHAIYGRIPGLKGSDSFVSSMGSDAGDGIQLGDANMSRPWHRLMMLGGGKFKHLFDFPQSVGIGVKVDDGLGGRLKADGGFHKEFEPEVHAKLRKGKEDAIRVLRNAGARDIVDFGLSAAGRVGGLVRIQEHVDANMETAWRGLHVCDASVIPDDMKGPPTLTVVCLARHLSRHLLSRI